MSDRGTGPVDDGLDPGPDLFASTRREIGGAIDVRSLSAASSWRGPATVLLEWTIILATIGAFARIGSWWLYPVGLVIVGSRQHALLVLMHDGAHFRLSRRRRTNEVIGEVLTAWPFFVTMDRYRTKHLRHHRETSTVGDPNWVSHLGDPTWDFPTTRRVVRSVLLRTALGLETLDTIRLVRRVGGADPGGPTDPADTVGPADTAEPALPRARWRSKGRLLAYAAMAVVLIATGTWPLFLVLWLVPLLTYLRLVMRIRAVGEHYGLPGRADAAWPATRSTVSGPVVRALVLPHHIHRHVEHHLYPSVPSYRLPALTEALRTSAPAHDALIHRSQGLKGVLAECLGADGS